LPSRRLAAYIIVMSVEPRKIGEAARCLAPPSRELNFEQGHRSRPRRVLPARLAPPAPQGRSVLPDPKGRKDRKDPSERKVPLAIGARPARSVPRDRLVPKARRGNRERKDQPVLAASAANPGRKDLPDLQALPGHPDPREIPVPRQPTVLSPARAQ
jgi:hypothetical protein